jgi:hypothetical protein
LKTVLFPGHVFVIERVDGGGRVSFNMYQSYISEYDFEGNVKRNAGSFELRKDQIVDILDAIDCVVTSDTWDKNCVRTWQKFTYVDTSELLGADIRNRIFLCYNSAPITTCVSNIRTYVRSKLEELDNDRSYSDDMVYYGKDHTKEIYRNADVDPLSVGQLRTRLHAMLAEMR